MITYTWEIRTLDTLLEDNSLERVIFKVHWCLTGNMDSYTYFVEGHEYLDSPNPETFKNYKELSEEDVIQWVVTSLGPKLDQIKRDIKIGLLRQQGKVVNLPKPWLLDPDLAPK